MANLRQSDSIAGIDSGQRIRRKAMGVSALEAHPSLNYYVAGISENANVESVVKLFQFGQQRELVSYSTSGSNARLTRCRFDPFGTRFGASDMRGNLKIWKFDASQDSLKPVLSFNSNSAVTNDFVFLSSATLLATAGISGSGNNIGLWDTLMPTSKARVKAFSTGDTGAYCLGYSHRHRVLLSGGKKGEVYIFDIRQRCLRKTVSAHSNTVKSLSVDDVMGNLVSASTDGEIKTWDLNSFLLDLGASSTSTEGLARKGQIGAQVERSSGVSSYGTMQVAICNSRIFSCGVDGSLRRSTVFTVKPFAPSAGVASL
ncbi:WD40-repeat-containing domain protein [Zopfochytrium polystomum]|nr:WD40-repeat-containing domain protein [Zopfochytrium polystomum]